MNYLLTTVLLAMFSTAAITQAFADYTIGIENDSVNVTSSVPITFGQVFKQGEVNIGSKILGNTNNQSSPIPLQMDVKSLYSDGSVRFSVISGQIPKLATNSSTVLTITTGGQSSSYQGLELAEFLANTADVNLTFTTDIGVFTFSSANTAYHAEAIRWLGGDIATEWELSGRPVDLNGQPHPFLSAKVNLRKFTSTANMRVDFAIENNNAYKNVAKNLSYALNMTIDGISKFQTNSLNHLRHARWRHTSWSSSEVALHFSYDINNLISTSMIPAYDTELIGNITSRHMNTYIRDFVSDERTYCVDVEGWDVSCDKIEAIKHVIPDRLGPMGIGFMYNYMGSSGTRPEIGPLPGWQAVDLLTQTRFTRAMTLTLGNLSGSWPVHYTDPNTGKAISIKDKPHASFRSNNTSPDQQIIKCTAGVDALCAQPYRPDASHQPLLTYLPYLMTGDKYYLDELIFWNHFNLLLLPSGDGYRFGAKGIFSNDQVRAQAWTLRTLGYTLAVLPNSDPNRNYYHDILSNNITNYMNNFRVNQYGALGPYGYNDPSFSGWQDDFFTWSIGNAYKLGVTEAEDLAKWKAKFSVVRMGREENKQGSFCWVFGGFNYLKMRDQKGSNIPFYQDAETLYTKNTENGELAEASQLQCASDGQFDALGLLPGQMYDKYTGNATNYVSIMRVALATAVDLDLPNAKEAWSHYISTTNQADMASNPTYALLPQSTAVLNTYRPSPPHAIKITSD